MAHHSINDLEGAMTLLALHPATLHAPVAPAAPQVEASSRAGIVYTPYLPAAASHRLFPAELPLHPSSAVSKFLIPARPASYPVSMRVPVAHPAMYAQAQAGRFSFPPPCFAAPPSAPGPKYVHHHHPIGFQAGSSSVPHVPSHPGTSTTGAPTARPYAVHADGRFVYPMLRHAPPSHGLSFGGPAPYNTGARPSAVYYAHPNTAGRASAPAVVRAYVPGITMMPAERTHRIVSMDEYLQAHRIEPVAPRRLPVRGGVRKPARNIHRPIKCSICSSGFVSQGRLRQHVLYLHNNHRPFECVHLNCDARFATRFARNQHYSTVHLKEKNYVCEFPGCGRKFGQKSHFNRHVRNLKHPQGN